VGATLQSDAERHLRASFDAADTAHRGTLSAAEAQAGGFGWIANHFDAIDTRHAGRVSFDDVRRYLALRDAGSATK
jgi:Ca2+-binding EF-hand superfamily protein